jgi:hypothetical protein
MSPHGITTQNNNIIKTGFVTLSDTASEPKHTKYLAHVYGPPTGTYKATNNIYICNLAAHSLYPWKIKHTAL